MLQANKRVSVTEWSSWCVGGICLDKVVSKLDFTIFLGATSTDTNMSNHASFGSIPVQAGDAGESTVFLCKRSKTLSMTSHNPWPPDRERHEWHGPGFYASVPFEQACGSVVRKRQCASRPAAKKEGSPSWVRSALCWSSIP